MCNPAFESVKKVQSKLVQFSKNRKCAIVSLLQQISKLKQSLAGDVSMKDKQGDDCEG